MAFPPADSLRHQVAAALTTWSDELVTPPAGRGRPPILTDTHLWGCTLLTVLDGRPTQRGIWGEVTTGERWGPPVDVVDEPVRKRLLTRSDKTCAVTHTLTKAQGVGDEVGFCGDYRADKGQTLLRRIPLPVPGGRPRTSLTSVLDPAVLPPIAVAQMYARRSEVLAEKFSRLPTR